MHDTGQKIVLGHQIAAGGEQDGIQVIDLLARHPSTARFISTKLARHFVADDPPPALIDRMARTFLKTDGDLRAVMQAMFTSREFFSQGAWAAKVKSPLEMVVSAVRALDANAADAFLLVRRVSDMGEPLYAKEAPSGYKDTADAWLSTANVLARINFANALANGQIAGIAVDSSRWAGKDVAGVGRELLGVPLSGETLAALSNQTLGSGDGRNGGKQRGPGLIAGLVLSSPDFERR
jgi:uncharacterized protein (DUF1800 family)